MLQREMVLDLRTGQTRPAVAQAPLLSSARSAWKGILVEKHRIGAFELTDVCCLNHVLFLQLESPVVLEWKSDGNSRLARVEPGQVSFVPAHLPHSVRSAYVGEFLSVSLEPTFLAGAAAEFGALDRLDLPPVFGAEDPLMRAVLESLETEAEKNHSEGGLYAESLATLLAVHVVRTYAGRNPQNGREHGGLGKPLLRRIVEFIQERLGGDIRLSQLAAEADLSPYHFARQFKRATGLAPHEYVTRCRVERAKELLLRPFSSITDVAVQVGFCDQSHLARYFKRFYGLTPAAFVRRTPHRKNIP